MSAGAWVRGMVHRVGIPGGYSPAHPLHLQLAHRCPGSKPNQRSGPRRALQGPGVGGLGAAGVTVGGDGHIPPCGPGPAHAGHSLDMPSECPPGTNKARIDLILLKLSQNREVSSVFIEKACHSP